MDYHEDDCDCYNCRHRPPKPESEKDLIEILSDRWRRLPQSEKDKINPPKKKRRNSDYDSYW